MSTNSPKSPGERPDPVVAITLENTLVPPTQALSPFDNAVTRRAQGRQEREKLEGARIADSFARITVAAAVMGAAVWLANPWLTARWPGAGLWTQVLIVGCDLGVGLAVLGAATQMLNVAEFDQARHQVLARWKRTRSR